MERLPQARDVCVAIRLDAGPRVGSGHAVRCMAVAGELMALGCDVTFLVADEDCAKSLRAGEWTVEVAGGDSLRYTAEDGLRLASLCSGRFDALIIDSYAITRAFFEGLGNPGFAACLVDDMYTFSDGALDAPLAWPVDLVVNYGFPADGDAYARAYAGRETRLLVGPEFAPVRPSFRDGARAPVGGPVERILVTSGSTNPDGALERMVCGCLQAAPGTAVDVVVGALADFDTERFRGRPVAVHRGLTDLSPLMADADIAVSAAGSTLYELSCMGVPTAAFPVVENQVANARGFIAWGLGAGSEVMGWSHADVAQVVWDLAQSPRRRQGLSDRMRAAVDGHGARRIAEAITHIGTRPVA